MLKPIDLEVYTPLDYWRTDAEYPPEGTGERFRRFDTYRDLSRGDFTQILPSWLRNAEPVQTNYFHTVPTCGRSSCSLSRPKPTASKRS